ncbi:MAG: hypothetical protein JXA99_10860 [Candidatus Lokiarchaeota archaeon]|nr:hypothetical protein [Candidatus Lokiarchaeota archaeon]
MCKLLRISILTLYKFKNNGTIINFGVNAGYNIMKKAFPNSLKENGYWVWH